MITKEYGKYKLICDNCGEAAEEEFDSFQEAIRQRKVLGWGLKKEGKVWLENCPECKEVE